jgi:NADPH:quinone reductase
LEPDPNRGSLKTARLRNLRISLELMLTPMLDGLIDEQDRQGKILQQCTRLIDRGSLKIDLARTFPLAEASAAHQLLEQGSMRGKIVLTMR